MATGERPSGAAGWGLFAEWHDLIEQRDPRFTWLSTVEEVQEPLSQLAASLTVSHWNMQRHWSIASIRCCSACTAVADTFSLGGRH